MNDILTQTYKMSDSKRDLGERVIYRTRKDSQTADKERYCEIVLFVCVYVREREGGGWNKKDKDSFRYSVRQREWQTEKERKRERE